MPASLTSHPGNEPLPADPMELNALALRSRLAAGELCALEVAEAMIARIAVREPEIRAWAHFDADRALEQARALDCRRDAGHPTGPLHGVPVAIKDIIDTADMPTENGTALDRGRRPTEDAALVSALRAAGALIAGKATTAELAFLHPTQTRNPHDPSRTPGGSSAGSAAAVAAGMVPLAVGTQTGGSVLRPASFCGVVGLKPSFGLISTRGVLRQSPSLDTIGTFARDIAGAAMLADALAVHDPSSAGSRPAPRLLDAALAGRSASPRFAFVRTPWWGRASDPMRHAVESLAQRLGERCAEADLPDGFTDAVRDRETVNLAEMAHCLHSYEGRGRVQLSFEATEAIGRGARVLTRDYLRALDRRADYRAGLDPLLERYDALLMPAAPGVAPEGLASTGDSVFNALATFTGAPAVSLPILWADGPGGPLPMGVQVMGRPGKDAALVRAAAWLERWADALNVSDGDPIACGKTK